VVTAPQRWFASRLARDLLRLQNDTRAMDIARAMTAAATERWKPSRRRSGQRFKPWTSEGVDGRFDCGMALAQKIFLLAS
jgi:hypothetical protein